MPTLLPIWKVKMDKKMGEQEIMPKLDKSEEDILESGKAKAILI